MSNSRSSFEQKYKLTSLYIPENVYTFKHVKSTTHLHVKQSWILSYMAGQMAGRQLWDRSLLCRTAQGVV